MIVLRKEKGEQNKEDNFIQIKLFFLMKVFFSSLAWVHPDLAAVPLLNLLQSIYNRHSGGFKAEFSLIHSISFHPSFLLSILSPPRAIQASDGG